MPRRLFRAIIGLLILSPGARARPGEPPADASPSPSPLPAGR